MNDNDAGVPSPAKGCRSHLQRQLDGARKALRSHLKSLKETVDWYASHPTQYQDMHNIESQARYVGVLRERILFMRAVLKGEDAPWMM